jgi:hypothetical protein
MPDPRQKAKQKNTCARPLVFEIWNFSPVDTHAIKVAAKGGQKGQMKTGAKHLRVQASSGKKCIRVNPTKSEMKK